MCLRSAAGAPTAPARLADEYTRICSALIRASPLFPLSLSLSLPSPPFMSGPGRGTAADRAQLGGTDAGRRPVSNVPCMQAVCTYVRGACVHALHVCVCARAWPSVLLPRCGAYALPQAHWTNGGRQHDELLLSASKVRYTYCLVSFLFLLAVFISPSLPPSPALERASVRVCTHTHTHTQECLCLCVCVCVHTRAARARAHTHTRDYVRQECTCLVWSS